MKQKMVDMHIPETQRIKATHFLGIFLPVGVSVMTVEVASSIEKAESIPSMNKVSDSKRVQKFGLGISSIAAG